MSKQELAKAKRLIQAKQYEDARAILLTIDHPTADKWLERLSSITQSTSDSVPQSFTGKLVVSIALLWIGFIPGLIAVSIFSKEAERFPEVPGAGGLILLNRLVFWLLMIILFMGILMAIYIILAIVGGAG